MWIKICGMTSPEAVEASLSQRVDALGFVFAPSVRRLEPLRAARLAAPARARALCVAVTLHPSQALIDQILREFAPDALQTDLEDLERLSLPSTLGRVPVVRAGTLAALGGAAPAMPARVLFEGARSGSGTASDWDEARRLAAGVELILAGGLNASNVAAAIERVRPFGIDVSSGVETAPGQKSPHRIVEFVEAARAAWAGTQHECN
jgi:phosphoribosylanthranilate isomerase